MGYNSGNNSINIEIDNTDISNKIGDLSQLNTTDKTSLTNAINSNVTQLAETMQYPIITNEVGVINKGFPYGDIRRYGAVGDGVTDSTTAIQNAINNAYTLSFSVYVPMGGFVINQSLQLPIQLKIKGDNDNPSLYNANYGSAKCYIITNCQNVFIASSSNTQNACVLHLEGVEFRNNYSTPSTATVFYNFEVYNATIFHNAFKGYGTVFYGSISQVSDIYSNMFEGIQAYFCDGPYDSGLQGYGCKITDSHIHHNYFDGSAPKNPTAFRLKSIAMTNITDNYFDFFKYCFDYQSYAQGVVITNNRFDYCYRVLSTSQTTVASAIYSTIFKANVIRYCSKTSCTSYFTAMTSDMTSNQWGGIEALKGFYQMNITDNQVISADMFINVNTYTVYAIRIANNVIGTVTTPITYVANKGNNASDQTDIYIDMLMYKAFTSYPNPVITGTNISSFNGQIVRYNNKFLYNNGGAWFDPEGNAVTT